MKAVIITTLAIFAVGALLFWWHLASTPSPHPLRRRFVDSIILQQNHASFLFSPTAHWWARVFLGVMIYLVILGWIDDRDATVLAADRATVSVSTTDCPPPAPGMTNTVVMVVNSQADIKPAIVGCTRVAMRSY